MRFLTHLSAESTRQHPDCSKCPFLTDRYKSEKGYLRENVHVENFHFLSYNRGQQNTALDNSSNQPLLSITISSQVSILLSFLLSGGPAGPRARGRSVKRGGASGPCTPAGSPESYGSSAPVLRCPQMTRGATLVTWAWCSPSIT